MADDVLEILALDVAPNDFYDVFFSKAQEKGFDIPALDEESELGRDQDVVQAICALALRAVKTRHYDGSRAAMCRDRDISKDKAYRLSKFLRNAEVFESQTDNIYDGCQRFISYHRNGEAMEMEVLAKEKADDPYEETIGVNQDGNEATISAHDTQIDSVDALMEQAGFDPDIWEKKSSEAKGYQVGMKLREILKFKDNGEPIYVENKDKMQLYSYSMKLARKERKPVNLEPIAPVSINVTQQYQARTPSGQDSGMNTALFVPDPQIGYRRDLHTAGLSPIHDRRAMDVILQVAAYLDPDDIIVLGDWLDFTDWTKKYTQSQQFRETTQPALAEGQWWLKQLALQHPDARLEYLLGNHEDRVRDMLINHFEQAFGISRGGQIDSPQMISVEEMLELDSIGFNVSESYPKGEVWLNDALKAIHGESAAKTVNRKILKTHDVSTIQGHNHRLGMKSDVRRFRGVDQPIYGVTAGCACRLESGVVPAVSNQMNWQQGFVTAQYDPGGIDHDVNITRIHEGRCIFRGKSFEANPCLPAIRTDTDYGDRLSAAYDSMT